jgi:hypothetical protein
VCAGTYETLDHLIWHCERFRLERYRLIDALNVSIRIPPFVICVHWRSDVPLSVAFTSLEGLGFSSDDSALLLYLKGWKCFHSDLKWLRSVKILLLRNKKKARGDFSVESSERTAFHSFQFINFTQNLKPPYIQKV